MKKRLLSALLALAMLGSAVPVPAFADDLAGDGTELVQAADTDAATVETADPEPTPTPDPEPTPEPETTLEAAGTLAAVPRLLAADDGVSTLANNLTTLVVGGTSVVANGTVGDTTSGDGWSYADGVLTLNNATITGTSATDYGAAIYAAGDLTIELNGSSSATGVVPTGDTPPLRTPCLRHSDHPRRGQPDCQRS